MSHAASHHEFHHHEHKHGAEPSMAASLRRTAWRATLHCLAGCAVGEVLGMVIGTALGMSNMATIALAVVLAYAFGYAFTMRPLLRAGITLRQAARLAFIADTASIAVMEVVDNLVMLAWPGAMDAPVSSLLFWSALAFSLAIAGFAAFPLNRWLIGRRKGHAVVNAYHHHH